MPRTNPLLAGTVVPVVIGLAVAAGGGHALASAPDGDAPTVAPPQHDAGALRFASCNPCGPCNPCAAACNPCGPCNPCNPCRPCAGACGPCSPCNPCNPCNPCAGACGPCGPCNPCSPCNPCNPCAGACGPCGACNPCAAGAAASSDCVVPRLAAASDPCGPCAPCNPCGPCNPCAAACNPCSPCNPCNPCGAACNPCAPCNPCNPCAAACNPCAPCNPCGPCGPCNPCAAGEEVELTAAEARDAYACISGAYGRGLCEVRQPVGRVLPGLAERRRPALCLRHPRGALRQQLRQRCRRRQLRPLRGGGACAPSAPCSPRTALPSLPAAGWARGRSS